MQHFVACEERGRPALNRNERGRTRHRREGCCFCMDPCKKNRRVRRIKSAPYSCDLCRELRWNNKHLGDDGFAYESSGV